VNPGLQNGERSVTIEGKDTQLVREDAPGWLKRENEMLAHDRRDQAMVQRGDCIGERWRLPSKVPPILLSASAIRIVSESISFRLDLLSQNLKQIWPFLRLFETHLPEADDVSMVTLSWTRIDLFTTEVRKYACFIARILGYECSSIFGSKCESHAQNVAADETEVRVRLEFLWVGPFWSWLQA